MSQVLFPGRVEVNPEGVSRAEIVVGIIAGDDLASLEEKRRQACRSLREFFPGKKGAVILSDDRMGSEARDAFLRTPMEVPGICISTPPGQSGKGNKVLNFLEKARDLGAESLAVVSRGPAGVSEPWVQRLLEPVYKEFSLVSPIYVRHPREGTLTNNIIYPLLRSLFGKRVREPAGGDFGLSASMADVLLEGSPEECVRGFGIDVWITTTAVARGIPLCQAFLGTAEASLSDAMVPEPFGVFGHTVETLFQLMDQYHDQWKSVRWSKPTVVFGVGAKTGSGREPEAADPALLYETFLQGFSRFEPLWRKILHRDVFEKLREVKKIPLENFEFPALMWALSLFAFALAYKRRLKTLDVLLECLLPLYLGRSCSTVISTAHMSPQQAEVYLDDQCRVFEETKPYLEYLWEKR